MFFYRRRSGILKWILGGVSGGLVILVVTVIVLKSTQESSFLAYTCVSTDTENYKLSSSSNLFDLKLFHEILAESTANLILSSQSVASVLAMLMLAANGDTFTELSQTLTLPCGENETDNLQVYLEAFKDAHESLQVGSAIKLESANRMYIDNQYSLNSLYEFKSNEYLSSKPEKVDFAQNPDVARGQINHWVESKTNQKIKDFLPLGSVGANTKIVLVNAIYFKGKWLSQFDASATNETGEFFQASGESIEAPMMYLQADLRSVTYQNVDIVKLPYEGGRLSMYILKPSDGYDLSTAQDLLTQKLEFDEILDEKVMTELYLPKFKIESSYELRGTLQNMGLSLIFDASNADLTGLNVNPEEKSLHVDKVMQKAFIEVNEEGTEAAAATGILMKTASVRIPQKSVIINRPFLFFIRDHQTGLNLFSGRIMYPEYV